MEMRKNARRDKNRLLLGAIRFNPTHPFNPFLKQLLVANYS